MRLGSVGLKVVLAGIAGFGLFAQTGELAEVRVGSKMYEPRPAIRVDANLVEIDVVVRDHRGRAVSGLEQGRFRIYDEGRERAIVAFSVDSAGENGKPMDSAVGHGAAARDLSQQSPDAVRNPRFLALFFDNVDTQDGPQIGNLRQTQAAAAKFVADALQPGVSIGIFTASGTQTLEFTTDAAKLLETIGELKPHPRMPESGLSGCPAISPYKAFLITQEHDGSAVQSVRQESALKRCPASTDWILNTADETWRRVRGISTDTLNTIERVVDYLGQRPGKRTLLLASAGFVAGTLDEQRQRVVEHARRAGVLINALDTKGVYAEAIAGIRAGDFIASGANGPSPSYIKSETLAVSDRMNMLDAPLAELAEKTGGVFIRNNNDLDGAFHELGIAPEITYRLAFKPEDVMPDGRFHAVKVKVNGAGTQSVTALPGYFAPSKQAPEALRAKLERAVTLTDAVAEFPMDVDLQNANALLVNTHVGIAALRFIKQNDRQMQTITFVTALLDSQGKIVAAKEGRMDFALKDATYIRLTQSGVKASLRLQAPPGAYTLREVVEEENDGKIACLTRAVEIH